MLILCDEPGLSPMTNSLYKKQHTHLESGLILQKLISNKIFECLNLYAEEFAKENLYHQLFPSVIHK